MVVDTRAYYGRSGFESSRRGTNQDVPSIEGPDEEEARGSKSTGCQCPSCAVNPNKVRRGRFEGFHYLDPEEEGPPEDELFFFLCAQRVFAFMLKSRTWGKWYWRPDRSP